jgi:hypothetical protein
MVEVEGEGISVWCRLRSGWGGPRCVVGLGVGWALGGAGWTCGVAGKEPG